MQSADINLFGVLIRFVLGGGAVAASFVLARLVGGRWGGIFAAFPAVYMAAIITVGVSVPPEQEVGVTLQVSKGALIGMIANIVCAISAVLFIPKFGWKKGLAQAIVIWLISVIFIYEIVFGTGLVR